MWRLCQAGQPQTRGLKHRTRGHESRCRGQKNRIRGSKKHLHGFNLNKSTGSKKKQVKKIRRRGFKNTLVSKKTVKTSLMTCVILAYVQTFSNMKMHHKHTQIDTESFCHVLEAKPLRLSKDSLWCFAPLEHKDIIPHSLVPRSI